MKINMNILVMALGVFVCSAQAIADTHDFSPLCKSNHPHLVVPEDDIHRNHIYDIKGFPKHVIYKSTVKYTINGDDTGTKTTTGEYLFDQNGSLIREITNNKDVENVYEYDNIGRIAKITKNVKTPKGIKKVGLITYSYFDDEKLIVRKEHNPEEKNGWYEIEAAVHVNESNGDQACYAITASIFSEYITGAKYILSKDGSRYTKFEFGDKKLFKYKPDNADAVMRRVLDSYRQLSLSSSDCAPLWDKYNGRLRGQYTIMKNEGSDERFTTYSCADIDFWHGTTWQRNKANIEWASIYGSKELADGKWQHHVQNYSELDERGNWTKLDFSVSEPATLSNNATLKLLPEHDVRNIEYWE